MNAARLRKINLGLNFLLIALSLAAWPLLPTTFAFLGYDLVGKMRLLWFVTPAAILLWNAALIWAFDTLRGRKLAADGMFPGFFEWCLLVSGTLPAAFFQLIIFMKATSSELFRASVFYLIPLCAIYVAYLFWQLYAFEKKMKQKKSF